VGDIFKLLEVDFLFSAYLFVECRQFYKEIIAFILQLLLDRLEANGGAEL